MKLSALLEVINERLLDTLGDAARNLQVGHAYFMNEAQPISSLIALRSAIRYDLWPLLQEYCAEDPVALHRILGDSFYDHRARRFSDNLMETGKEQELIGALIAWSPERLASDLDEEAPEPEPEPGDDGER